MGARLDGSEKPHQAGPVHMTERDRRSHVPNAQSSTTLVWMSHRARSGWYFHTVT
jgi:hypothetical protein